VVSPRKTTRCSSNRNLPNRACHLYMRSQPPFPTRSNLHWTDPHKAELGAGPSVRSGGHLVSFDASARLARMPTLALAESSQVASHGAVACSRGPSRSHAGVGSSSALLHAKRSSRPSRGERKELLSTASGTYTRGSHQSPRRARGVFEVGVVLVGGGGGAVGVPCRATANERAGRSPSRPERQVKPWFTSLARLANEQRR
jgi:hypothetical protein